MTKRVTCLRVMRKVPDFPVDDRTYMFVFSILDSSLGAIPGETSAADTHRMDVTITFEVLVNWGFVDLFSPGTPLVRESDLVKVLGSQARKCIQRQIEAQSLATQSSLRLGTTTAPARRPPDIASMPDPVGFSFDVEV
jgi:hypothetical protein